MIYVIDDDASVRTSLARLLRSAGYEARGFGNAQAYLDAAGAVPATAVDCVILDLHLPGMSGLALQEVIHHRDPPVPVIILSATEDADMRAKAVLGGAANVLRKPCDGTVLLGAVASAIARSSLSPRPPAPPQGSLTPAGQSDPDGFIVQDGHGVYRPVCSATFDQAVALVRSAIAATRRHRARDLLVDTTGFDGVSTPDTIQRLLAVVEWAEAAEPGLRLVLVARAEVIHPQKIGVLVAANRGLTCDIFTTEAEARAWLAAWERE
ncbi:MAG: response regulator transcription factor [Phycisphaerae bacterium]|nr:response regulator [Tepidisphaeraceae bacterium]